MEHAKRTVWIFLNSQLTSPQTPMQERHKRSESRRNFEQCWWINWKGKDIRQPAGTLKKLLRSFELPFGRSTRVCDWHHLQWAVDLCAAMGRRNNLKNSLGGAMQHDIRINNISRRTYCGISCSMRTPVVASHEKVIVAQMRNVPTNKVDMRLCWFPPSPTIAPETIWRDCKYQTHQCL